MRILRADPPHHEELDSLFPGLYLPRLLPIVRWTDLFSRTCLLLKIAFRVSDKKEEDEPIIRLNNSETTYLEGGSSSRICLTRILDKIDFPFLVDEL